MITIQKNLIDPAMYWLKSPYKMTPSRIVIHNTANDASAKNEISYMRQNKNEVSFHYAVDDIEIVQGIEENRNGWHAGDGNGKGNREGIAIEICFSKSGGMRFDAAEKNAAKLTADILQRYGWDISKVTKHQDYAKKYCPHRTLDNGWDRFLNMVSGYLHEKEKDKSQSANETNTNARFLVRITGDIVNVRKGPGVSYAKVTLVRKGEIYTIVEQQGEWGRLKSGAGWIHLKWTCRV